MIKIIVDGQSLRWYDRAPKVAADSVEFVKFKFLLSEEWDDHVVVAQFSQKGATYNKVLEDGCCTLPVEIEDGKCFISIFGQIPGGPERATVIPLLTDVSLSGFVGNGETSIPPTPDLYSQLIDYFLRHSSGGAGAVDPEDIAQAVEDYLTEHPIESPDLTDQVARAESAAAAAESAKAAVSASVNNAGSYASVANAAASRAKTSETNAASYASQAAQAAAEAKDAIANLPESGGSLEVSGAAVGQMVVIKAVDENGVPTAWEAADVPDEGVMLSGSGVPATVVAPVGALYMDTDTQEVYKCTKIVDGMCVWVKFNAALEKQLENKLDASKLTEAVEDALTQAKESGEFDGDDYVLTEDDKLEIAEQVSKLSGGNVDLTGVVKSVNGQTPDENGNVEIIVSGGTAVASVEPAEDDIPKVFITGVKPTTKDDVLAEMEYVSKTDRFHAYLTIKCQGTSSMNYPKKNFTVKMYSDEARETKLEKSFKDWNHNGNKYVLKANYIDHSHARNIVSARLWGEVVASRPDYDSLPVEMRNAPNNGAVDGFPIKVYYNGTYEGVYTWNIGKDDWQWGMDEDNPDHVLLCAETNTNGTKTATSCNFRALWNGVYESNWSVEVGTNSTALKTSLNNLIQFVMDNNGDAFRNGIGNYLDIQSAIDYYIFQYEICGLDGLAKNMLLATYDGTKWFCGAYDMDSTFGLWWDGGSFVAATYACPEDYQEDYSLLWERIEANFLPELKARQAELRKSVLSYSNMVNHFERFTDIIGKDLYAEDLTIYTAIPCGATNNIKQIRDYIRDRQAYVDAEFAAMIIPVACTGISLDKSALTFTAEGTQTLTATVSPDDCNEPMFWVVGNPEIATISVDGNVCTVETVGNGNTAITATCGNYSANCSVAVSGIAEGVPCTGITLNKTTLDFDGGGTETLSATVTPSDTTDKVVWTSDNRSIAIVENGVVTPMKSGSCNIVATCGEYSASCAVTVTNMGIDYTLDALAGVTWLNGYYIDKQTGAVAAKASQHITEPFSLQDCMYDYNAGSGNTWSGIYVYDENDNYLMMMEPNNNGVDKFYGKPGYKYRIQVFSSDATTCENATLIPVNNSENAEYMSFDLSTFEWVLENGKVRYYVDDDLKSAVQNSDQCNMGIQLPGNTGDSGWNFVNKAPEFFALRYYGTTYWLETSYFTTVEAAVEYFTQNNTVLEFNKRYQ